MGETLLALRMRRKAPRRDSLEALRLLGRYLAHLLADAAEQEWKGNERFVVDRSSQFGERLSEAEQRAAVEIFKESVRELTPFLLLVHTEEQARALASALVGRPAGVSDYRLRLLLAVVLTGLLPERLVPCAACAGFFVARSRRKLTCSDRCRQRYHRATQDPDALRGRERRGKRLQRERRKAETTSQAGPKPPAGRTSHPSR